jgi:hypothetical protein
MHIKTLANQFFTSLGGGAEETISSSSSFSFYP